MLCTRAASGGISSFQMLDNHGSRSGSCVIQAAAHGLFKLKRPSEEQPFIKGLLDPCTNSKIAPNIPAEKLYDKQAGIRPHIVMLSC